jgi:hypothetical protein
MTNGNRGPQDRARVSLTEDYEVRYWTKRFGVTKAKLQQFVKKYGHSVKKIEEGLKKK